MLGTKQTIIASLLIFITFFSSSSYSSSTLSGVKTINLITKEGERIPIGNIEFLPSEKSISYQLKVDYSRFQDYFLSMKEMKCLEGPELWCHIMYPYKQPHIITIDDLRWLEHDLLFMFKKKGEFGANFRNGIYYSLTLKDGVILGEAKAIDLNLIAAPFDNLDTPFYGKDLQEEIEHKQRWLPYLEIR